MSDPAGYVVNGLVFRSGCGLEQREVLKGEDDCKLKLCPFLSYRSVNDVFLTERRG
jgi:hypothetical protein